MNVTDESSENQLNHLLEIVKDNNKDWDTWVYLLSLVESKGLIELIRNIFDSFLSSYPLCFGYWKKYAELELSKGFYDRCIDVFERGVNAIPLSIDLWVHYLTSYKSYSDATQESIRDLFEKGISIVGKDWKAEPLWSLYINWEEFMGNFKAMFKLYKRMLALPLDAHPMYCLRFEKFVEANEVNDILSKEDIEKYEKEFSEYLQEKTNEDYKKALKEKIIESCRVEFKVGRAVADFRQPYEEKIKRTYFHVKELEPTQLKAWTEYLNFEEEQPDNVERIHYSYERCLIPCALYENFWLRYAWYLRKDKEKATAVLLRAARIHLPKSPKIHLTLASLYESMNDIHNAREVLQNILKQIPTHLETITRCANFEKRFKKFSKAIEIYETAIINMNPEADETMFLNVTVCDLIALSGEETKARQKFLELIEKHEDNKFLFLRFLNFEMNVLPKDSTFFKNVQNVFKIAQKSKLDTITKNEFILRELEFYDNFASETFTDYYEIEQKYRSLNDFDNFSLKRQYHPKSELTTESIKRPAVEYSQPSVSVPSPYGQQWNSYSQLNGWPQQLNANWTGGSMY